MTTVDLRTIKTLRDGRLASIEDIDFWFQYFLGVHLAKIPIEDGNSNPLQFAWDVYSTTTIEDMPRVTNFLAMASRGSQKTLTCACLITILLLHDQYRDIIHMASIQAQAKVLFKVWLTKFAARQHMTDAFPTLTMQETKSHVGKMLTVTHGTMDAVNAHHGGMLLQDEVDLTDPIVFDESKGMLTASEGKVPINVMISSRKFAMGNIQTILDKVDEDPDYASQIRIHKWGILENTRRCDEVRSGDFGSDIYVDKDDLVALPFESYTQLTENEKGKYEKFVGFANCLKCGIFSFCLGQLKKQVENVHLSPIEVTTKYFRTDEREFFKAQRLNRKPSTKGLAFKFYDTKKHDKTLGEMAEMMLETTVIDRDNMTLEQFYDRVVKVQQIPLYIGIDFGYNEVCAELLTIDKKGRVFVLDELFATETSDRELALAAHGRWGWLPINYMFPDVASPGGIKEARKIWDPKCGICTTTNKDRDYGINMVRNKLMRPGTTEPALFINKMACRYLRFGFKNCRYKLDPTTNEPTDQIQKKFDHAVDCVRYILATIISGAPFSISFGEGIEQPTRAATLNGIPTNIVAPTGEEMLLYANKQMIPTQGDMDTLHNEAKQTEGGVWFGWAGVED